MIVAPEPKSIDPIYTELATATVLADMHEFADWLGGECEDQNGVGSDYECRMATRLLTASNATLMHAALTSALTNNEPLTWLAVKQIAANYLAENKDRIDRLAEDAAADALRFTSPNPRRD